MSKQNINNHIETIQKNRLELAEVCFFLESKGLECRGSSLGNDRVQYYRGRDLKQIFDVNKFIIAEMINKKINKDIGPKGYQSIENFYEMYNVYLKSRFLQHMILIKADKFEEDLKKKFPKRLKPLPREELLKFDENKLYVVNLQRPIKKGSYVYLSICIFLVLFFCTLPIWPLSMKFYIWWVCLILLSLLLLFFVLRLVIILVSYIFGYELWLLPNLFDANLPILQTFSPLVGWCRVENDWKIVLFRILLSILIVLICIEFYINPRYVTAVTDVTSHVFNETLTWGYNKLAARYNTSTALNIYTKHQNIMDRMDDL